MVVSVTQSVYLSIGRERCQIQKAEGELQPLVIVYDNEEEKIEWMVVRLREGAWSVSSSDWLRRTTLRLGTQGTRAGRIRSSSEALEGVELGPKVQWTLGKCVIPACG